MLGMSEPSSHSSSQGESLKHYAVLFVQHRKIGTAVKDSVKQSRKPVRIYNFVCVSRCVGGLLFLFYFYFFINFKYMCDDSYSVSLTQWQTFCPEKS